MCQCGCERVRIGEDISEKLDYTPGVFTVERHIRGKWVCQNCETLIQAPVPAHVIDKGIPTTGLLASVLINQYADHLPLYRQEQIFARAGLAIPRSTLGAWVGMCGVQLQPLVDALHQEIPPGCTARRRDAGAYTEFLAMLLHDEIARRDTKKLGVRLARVGFAMGKTLETFNFDLVPKLNRTYIHDLATGRYIDEKVLRRYIDEKVCVLLVGGTGVGKSHLAQALGHCAARQGRDVMFISQTDLLKKLHAARATGLHERKFQQFVRVPLLIIDDFAVKPLHPPHDEDFHDLIAARYERAASIVT